MAQNPDNLNPPPAPSRVYYSLGRMLNVEDFQSDQDYHRGSLARALLQLCGTGTVSGLYVSIPQFWQGSATYAASAFVYDSGWNVQVNSGTAGVSGVSLPPFAAAKGGTANDANGIVWTNEGLLVTSGWLPNKTLAQPLALMDSNANVQVLNVPTLTTGAQPPVWNTSVGGTTLDGTPPQPVWTCAGQAQVEVSVSPGLAIDRVGRMIEVPQRVCIYLQSWLAAQSVSDLTSAFQGGNVLVDVFATFAPCTRGATPAFAARDDYNATDAFRANRLLDSFAMQLVLRTDQNPQLPRDPWKSVGTTPTAAQWKQAILAAQSGPASLPPFASGGVAGAEYPPNLDTSAVFLARILIPAAAPTSAGLPPSANVNQIFIDNMSRLFLYPTSVLARAAGLSSGTTS